MLAVLEEKGTHEGRVHAEPDGPASLGVSDRDGRQNPRRKRQDQTEGAKQEEGSVQSLSRS